MKIRKPDMLLVCLVFLGAMFAVEAQAWNYLQTAAADRQEDLYSPSTTQSKQIEKVKPKKIVKCKPLVSGPELTYALTPKCILPPPKTRGWEMTAEALFARTKGHVRYYKQYAGYYALGTYDIDLNADMGLPDHNVIGTFTAAYRFQPQWSLRYSIIPMALEGTGTTGANFTFGSTTFTSGQPTRVKWERLYQRIGLVYDPIRTVSSRVSIFGDYVRLDDKLSAYQSGCCAEVMNADLNMAIAGVEFEKCLKTTANWSTLSIECSAGVAFGDEAVGSDVSTGLKYSIPMSNGRTGFIKGGYRYLTYKKKYSDARSFDTAMDGGFLQMGFVF
ncbi:MAG: TonB-dependent receptor [Desulfomonile tiedjei]|uniref:TonB-dependent receptor n=1 Tax=Desulfomonile tiedjei TaxID=2358 RepID=A0A9D6Z570_9BACT|nr:TonB-dependent receptor [Desulfomonile tiedjei]